MSLDAKPTPVDRPPDTTTSHVLLTCSMARLISSQMPHTRTCMTFFPITLRLAAVRESFLLKWSCMKAIVVLLI